MTVTLSSIGLLNRIISTLAVVLCSVLPGASSPVENFEDLIHSQSDNPNIQRLAYTVSIQGIAVARAVFDEVRPAYAGDEWTVRVAAGTTSFWDQFARMYNIYTTSFTQPDFRPSRYLRQIDQTGRRFDRIEWYGDQRSGFSIPDTMPPIPARYLSGGETVEPEIFSVPAGQGNFFSALWYVRYTDWDATLEIILPLWLDGQRWRVHIRKVGIENRNAPEGRVETWKLTGSLSRNTAVPDTHPQDTENIKSDHLTSSLMDEDLKLTFWIERSGLHRPITVKTSVGIFSLVGQLRNPFEDEILKD